jgi:hypothetical protein
MTLVHGVRPAVPHQQLTEPALVFDARDTRQQHLNPLAGLAEYGPYSASAWTASKQDARVAILAPHNAVDPVRDLLNSLRHQAEARERREYLPAFPGFTAAFRARLIPADEAARQPLPADLDDRLTDAMEPHRVLAEALVGGLRRLKTVQSLFDVVVFYLPDRWQTHFTAAGFDLHDHVKAAAARLGLPTQIVTDQAMTYRCRASVNWRLSTALYAKAGGTPYKLATGALLDPSTAYVGLAYGIRESGRPGQSFVVCCSQMFDAQGGGLEFIAYDVSDDIDPRNPLLTCAQMRTVLSRTLNVYADRHAGRRPTNLVVHKTIAFTDDEAQGAADAWGRSDGLTCVSLARPAWRGVFVTGVHNERTGGPRYGYAVDRGTLVQLDGHSALLWVAGNARDATLTEKSYLQGGKGTPRPLLLTRHVGAGPLAEPAAQVLALSKMDWNTDALYSSLPATLTYAQLLARIVKYEHLPPVPYDYRLFM